MTNKTTIYKLGTRMVLTAFFTVHCSLFTIYAQQLSLDQAIRQAQDSTIMAFQSRHEYNYYRSITMSFRLCASVDLLYHPGSHFGCGRPAQCRQSRGGEERCGTPRSHARPASSPQVWHVGYHYIGENRQLNIVICKNLLAFANPL